MPLPQHKAAEVESRERCPLVTTALAPGAQAMEGLLADFQYRLFMALSIKQRGSN